MRPPTVTRGTTKDSVLGRCAFAVLRVLRLGGYSTVEGTAFAASLPELDLQTVPTLPQLGELTLGEVRVRTACSPRPYP